MKHISANIYGHVQGVGFRYTTMSYAKQLNLTGYVQNMDDGSVHIEAQGGDDKLSQLIDAIKNGLDQFADVTKVNVKEKALTDYSDFNVKL